MEAANQPQKVTSAKDYFKKFGIREKLVTLPSGETFKIRKFQLLDFIHQVMIPSGILKESDFAELRESKNEEERVKILSKNLTADSTSNLQKHFLLVGIAEPKIIDSEEFDIEKGELGISVIDSLDKVFLVNEILDFNGLSESYREGIRPFRGE